MTKSKPGLYANIHAKQERIAHGSGEKTRAPGSPGAPTQAAFDAASKTTRAAKKTAAAKKSKPARKTAAKKSSAASR
jgi:hypothetical protein